MCLSLAHRMGLRTWNPSGVQFLFLNHPPVGRFASNRGLPTCNPSGVDARLRPGGHKRDDPEACLAHGRDEARPGTARPAVGPYRSSLFPPSFPLLARQRPPLVTRHLSLQTGSVPVWCRGRSVEEGFQVRAKGGAGEGGAKWRVRASGERSRRRKVAEEVRRRRSRRAR